MANEDQTDALAMAAFAAEAVAEICAALVRAGAISGDVTHRIADYAEQAAMQCSPNHATQMRRLVMNLRNALPTLGQDGMLSEFVKTQRF